ncbi:TorA maturation chaperone TorD [Desulfosalsimonas propionicica]|uniref:TorA maturation chaperone TorD n=1 Tax=Desulfosalsimonas propionicica TaxID=332175 RepID=A0A7W0HL75_9BACT|nr:molecular chaperone TorD family protein [Desulfosalsimonas propionicica]MBA2882034.1 TorA maturation chaperone TorD [Desulfosalsimonas propionicica]
MNPDPITNPLGPALRDFFISADASGHKRAYLQISEALQNPLPRVNDWRQVEYAFTRLFVGPKSLEAPPFASVYLETEPLVMGPTTMMVRSVYEMMGLVSPWKNALPEDHVSLELDAALVMENAAQQGGSAELDELRQFFVCRHMAAWIPAFVKRVSQAESAHPAIVRAAKLAGQWVDDQAVLINAQRNQHLKQGGWNG